MLYSLWALSCLVGFLIGFLWAGIKNKHECKEEARIKLDILRKEDCWRLENWGKFSDSNPVHAYGKLIIALNYGEVPPRCLDLVTTKIKPESIGSSMDELEAIRRRIRRYTVEALIDSARKHLMIVKPEVLKQWLEEAGYSFSDVGVTEEELIELNRQTQIYKTREN